MVTDLLLDMIKTIAHSVAGGVRDQSAPQVLYFLQELQQHKFLQGAVMLVLSEFAVMHESIRMEVVSIIISALEQDLNNRTALLLEGSILGLSNILESSPDLLDSILGKMLELHPLGEGIILALQYFGDKLKEIPILCHQITAKLVPMINSPRVSPSLRLNALYLAGSSFFF